MDTKLETKGQGHSLLLAILVLAATGAAIFLLRPGGDEESGAAAGLVPAPDDSAEVKPIVPQARITNASWDAPGGPGTGASAHPGDGSPLDLLDKEPVDEEKLNRTRTSLEETVKDIDGLGIYVAPEPEEKPNRGR